MRYQFNSYSMPDADLDTLFSAAHRYGYDGVELRLTEGHRHGVEPDLSATARARVRRQIDASGLRVDCLCSSARLAVPSTAESALAETERALSLAADIGARYVRVFGGPVPDDTSRNRAGEALVDGLRRAGAGAAGRGVTVLLETHDDWAAPATVARIMSEVGHPTAVGVLWDVWHTGRTGRSSVGDAHAILEPWIRHVQMHDGMLRQDRLAWRRIGQGEVDHLEMLACLLASGYDGAVSGEWIDWEPADEHLPRELATMRHYEQLLRSVRTT
ncbi:MAG: sugar phosphate isomerase/epimerase family protein [Dermatophilaceae bacterium]